jgi:NAD(P)-dependent dehydrogenase (short-subunit alcohol dehydrogenase family)
MRTVVVGASTGLGRCIGLGLVKRGAQVAFLARRTDKLESAVAEAGAGAYAVRCDVTDEAGCWAAIDEAAERLGGIDALVYATGMGRPQRIEDTDAAAWRQVLDTNVVGAAIATAAALPHLRRSERPSAAYLSSVSASLTRPWPGLGAYVVSKTALDKMVEAWQAEHGHMNFTRIVVGDCIGGEGDGFTDFNNGWDLDVAASFGPVWAARGYVSGAFTAVEELVDAVDLVLRAGPTASIPSITVTPRRPA